MTRMCRLPPVLVLAALLAAGQARADRLQVGENLLTLPASAAARLSVSVWVGPPATRFCDDWRWGVAGGGCPHQSVQALAVWRAGSEVRTHLSAYLDLGEPREARVRWHGPGKPFELVLQGGEAAAAWEAVLAFSGTLSVEDPDIMLPTGLNGRLVSRRVRFLSRPGWGWEATRYGPPRVDAP